MKINYNACGKTGGLGQILFMWGGYENIFPSRTRPCRTLLTISWFPGLCTSYDAPQNEMQWVCLVQFFKKGKKENSMVAIHIFSCDSLYYILFVHKRNQPIHYRSFHQSRVAKKLLNVVYIHMSVYFSKLRHDRAHLG